MQSVTNERELNRRAYAYGSAYRRPAALLVLTMAAGALVGLLQPTFMGNTLDAIIAAELRRTYLFLAAMLAATLLQGAISLGETYLTARLSTSILWRVKEDLYQRLVCLTMPVYDRTRQGELLSRIEGDAGAIGGLIMRRLHLVLDIARMVIILGLVLRLSVVLTLVQLIILPLMFLTSGYFGEALRQANLRNRKLMDGYMSFVQESAAGYREVKSLQLERRLLETFGGLSDRLATSIMGIRLTDAYAGLSNMLIGGVGSVVVIGFAAWQIINGHLSIGQLVAFTAYAGQLAGALRSITDFRRTRRELLASIERVFELLDRPAEPVLPRLAQGSQDFQGYLKLEDVCFGYSPEHPVLQGVSFQAMPGSITGLAGLSGSGKTTLFNLVLRFYLPQGGDIYLDGHNIQDLDLVALRRAIAVVGQDPFFFRASIRENLLHARPDARDAEIREACRLANAGDFVEALADGYDTVLSDRGASLSGGQRQRLALARAILRRSPVLLCDEVTSALDAESEHAVHEALRRLAGGHTIILVAHRPSTMQQADHIVVLHQGQVVGEGRHEALLQQNEVYRRLYTEWSAGDHDAEAHVCIN